MKMWAGERWNVEGGKCMVKGEKWKRWKGEKVNKVKVKSGKMERWTNVKGWACEQVKKWKGEKCEKVKRWKVKGGRRRCTVKGERWKGEKANKWKACERWKVNGDMCKVQGAHEPRHLHLETLTHKIKRRIRKKSAFANRCLLEVTQSTHSITRCDSKTPSSQKGCFHTATASRRKNSEGTLFANAPLYFMCECF
jgi:hypothetical protein